MVTPTAAQAGRLLHILLSLEPVLVGQLELVLSSTRSRRRSNSPLDRETAVFVLREPVSQQHHARPIRSRLHPPSFNSSEIKGHIERTANLITCQ